MNMGRIVILRDSVRLCPLLCFSSMSLIPPTVQHFDCNLAMILRPAQTLAKNVDVAAKSYLVLVLVDEETKSGDHGKSV